MKKGLLALFFISCAVFVFSQNSGYSTRELLMKNPDVLWIAESEEVVLLDILNPENAENREWLESMGILLQRRVLCEPIKNQRNSNLTSNSDAVDFTLSARTLTSPKLNQVQVYSDPACTQLVKNPYIKYMVDTINPALIQSYKLRQLFYFDKKANTFGSLPLAFAPVADVLDKNGKLVDHKLLFWMKIEHSSQPIDLKDDNIQWARKIIRQFDFVNMKVIKSEKSIEDCINLHWETMRENAKTEDIRNTLGTLEKLSEKEIASMGVSIDTITNFDPETFDEYTEVVTKKVEGKNVEEIRWSQEWYWDEQANKMIVYNGFFALIISRYDSVGMFMNSGPMYFKQAK